MRADDLTLLFDHLYFVRDRIQQFTDAAVLLTAAGQSPGELDFLDFVERREAGGS